MMPNPVWAWCYQDFMCSVKHYGKIIIAETHLPPEIKTIKPASAHDRRLLFFGRR
jgi:hypothetical protein